MSISIDKLNKEIDFTGVIASPVDERDYTVAMASVGVSEEIPDCWETWQPPVENQGNTGNCVAQTFANIMECIDHRDGLSHRDRSVGSIYGRSLASTPGMIPRQGCEAIVKHGVLYRDIWEYLGENPECRNRLLKVPSEIMTTAKKAKMYIRINTFEEMQRFMMKYNLPVYGSGKVSEFIDERLGEGRHAVTLFGWSSEDFVKKNKKKGRVQYQNSWGVNSGWTTKGQEWCNFDELEEVWGIVPYENKSDENNKSDITTVIFELFKSLVELFAGIIKGVLSKK